MEYKMPTSRKVPLAPSMGILIFQVTIQFCGLALPLFHPIAFGCTDPIPVMCDKIKFRGTGIGDGLGKWVGNPLIDFGVLFRTFGEGR